MIALLAILVLLAVTVWSYGPVARELLTAWQSDDDYSAGALVPLIAAFLVWRDRKALRQLPVMPCWWGGIGLLALAEAVRAAGLLLMRPSLGRYPLVFIVAALVLMVGGRRVFRRILWILVFLLLMVPLPAMVHNRISPPLQGGATTGSTILLGVSGIAANQQGNIVVLNGDTSLAVAEACSGLRMLMAFIIAAALMAYIVRRPRWEKVVLLVSSLPIAVICNIIRIFVTALLVLYVGTEVAEKFFHDFAGYFMTLVAVLLLFAEVSLLDKLVTPEPDHEPRRADVVTRRTPRAAKTSARKVPDHA